MIPIWKCKDFGTDPSYDRSLGGGFYESGKFSSQNSQLTIADAVWNVAKRQLKRR